MSKIQNMCNHRRNILRVVVGLLVVFSTKNSFSNDVDSTNNNSVPGNAEKGNLKPSLNNKPELSHLSVIVVGNGKFLNKADVNILGVSRSETDAHGKATFVLSSFGQFSIRVIANGFITAHKKVTINKGSFLEEKFNLKVHP